MSLSGYERRVLADAARYGVPPAGAVEDAQRRVGLTRPHYAMTIAHLRASGMVDSNTASLTRAGRRELTR